MRRLYADWFPLVFFVVLVAAAVASGSGAAYADRKAATGRTAATRLVLPSSISNLGLWLDADTQCSGVAGGTAVSSWTDRSGSGNTVSQSTAANQPTCQSAVQNSRAVIRFDGSNDQMNATQASRFFTADATIIAVMAFRDTTGHDTIVAQDTAVGDNQPKWVWGYNTPGGSQGTMVMHINGAGQGTGNNGDSVAVTRTANQFRLLSMTATGSTGAYTFRGERQSLGTDTATVTFDTNTADLTIGFAEGSEWASMDLAELVVYKAALTAAQVDQIENYLAQKWNLPAKGAATNPIPEPVFSAFMDVPTRAEQTPGNCTDPNVAAWFSLDESSGNLTVPTGCAASGTAFAVTGTPTYGVRVPNGLGSGITTGSGNYFTTSGDVASLDPGTSSMVVEGWVNASSGTGGTVVAKFDNSSAGWLLDQSASSDYVLRFYISDGATTCQATSGTALAFSAWQHFRATWNGVSTCTIVTNGDAVISATQAVGSVNITTAASLGARQNGSNTFAGSIADVRVTIGNGVNDLGFNDGTMARAKRVGQTDGNCTDSNVAAWLSLDEASGNLTVPSTPAGCAAAGTVFTAFGTPVYGFDGPPGLGDAIEFDVPSGSSADYFSTVNDIGSLDGGTSNLVVEAWLKTTASNTQYVVSKIDADAVGYALYLNGSGQIRFFVEGPSPGFDSVDVASTSSYNDGQWHRARGTYVNATGTATITVDGRPAVSGTTAAMAGLSVSNGAATSINCNVSGATPSNCFVGLLADVRITIGNSTNDLGFAGPANDPFFGTFTRATASTMYDSYNGTTASVASGYPVVEPPLESTSALPGGRMAGYYSGSATTFAALNNEVLTAANWPDVGTPVRTQNAVTAPDGATTADRIEDDSASVAEGITANFTVASGASTWTATAWTRCAVSHSVRLVIGFGEGPITTDEQTCSTTWTRMEATLAKTSSTTATVQMYATDSTVGSLGIAEFWRPQLYNKAFAVPLDPAVAATAVTVNADDLSFTEFFASWSGITGCAWEWHPAGDTANGPELLSFGDFLASGTASFRIIRTSATNLRVLATGSPAPLADATVTAGQWNFICGTAEISGTSNVVRSYLAGALANTSSAVDVTQNTTHRLRIGAYAGDSSATNQWQGHISRLRVWDRVLTAAEITAIYDAEAGNYP